MQNTVKTTTNQRVLEIYQTLKNRLRVRSKTDFARIAGFTNTHWSEYEQEKRRFTHKHLRALVTHFRDLSLHYLETGEGEAFGSPEELYDVQALGLLADMPGVELPFVSLKARASFIDLGGAEIGSARGETLRLMVLAPDEASRYVGAVVFEVDGDSMEPLMHTGQRIIAWPIPEAKWEHINNQVCVVAYDDTVTIKAVRSNDLFTQNMLVLHALAERAGYLPVARHSIRSIWRVDEFFDRPKIRL